MKRLIAQRPIQYMGQTYEPGDAIPAGDPRMVEAWLGAKSAAWIETTPAAQQPAKLPSVNDQAADALRAMGVTIEDGAGEFVGAAALEEQIRNMALEGQQTPQDGADGPEGQDPTGGGKSGEDGQQGAGAGEMLTGHLDAAQLARMTKTQLEELAGKMGVDISSAKNNTERAAILAAVEVQAPADGGAQ